MKKRPLVIAHRGSSRWAPENTLAAFSEALREGADGVEMDVWKCASGELVLIHDPSINRLTGKSGKVEKMTLTELKTHNFGEFSAQRFKGEAIATLDEALDLLKDTKIINIELKGKNLISNGIEQDTLKILHKHRLKENILVSSFNPAILYRMHKIDPQIKLGLLCFDQTIRPIRRAWAKRWIPFYSLHPNVGLLNEKWISEIRKNEKLIPWTVNNKNEVETCIQHQVDAMITDDPAWLLQTLRIDYGLH